MSGSVETNNVMGGGVISGNGGGGAAMTNSNGMNDSMGGAHAASHGMYSQGSSMVGDGSNTIQQHQHHSHHHHFQHQQHPQQMWMEHHQQPWQRSYAEAAIPRGSNESVPPRETSPRHQVTADYSPSPDGTVDGAALPPMADEQQARDAAEALNGYQFGEYELEVSVKPRLRG